MDIRFNAKWPASALSNFSAHPFVFRGIPVASMEGFLQGLKFQNPEMQRQVFLLVGLLAKRKGKNRKWRQTLWLQGKPIERQSHEYQTLLDDAYEALAAQNQDFRQALLATGDAKLTHSLGKSDPAKTVLTEEEFCARLMAIRASLNCTKKAVHQPK